MPGYLVRSSLNPSSLALSTTSDLVEGVARSREVRDIYREGIKHLVAERIQALKIETANDLANDVYRHALREAEEFSRDAFTRLNQAGRDPEHQAYYHSLVSGLLARYENHLNGLVEVGVTNIATEAHKPVIVPKEERRGWFR